MMRPLNSNNKLAATRRKKAQFRGRLAENIAVFFLRVKLFSILKKNFKTPVGEIDIIAKRGDLLIFVEVKMRNSKQGMAQALEAVNQDRIIRAAKYFLACNPQMADKNLRFDVIFLAPFAFPVHFKGAFVAD
ncbi:MAG: YraN family protein [Devosiaceae bacterium]|nr:YraN family protein [Devosiaceae bacterium]